MKKKLGSRQRHARIFATLREAAQAGLGQRKNNFFPGERMGEIGSWGKIRVFFYFFRFFS